MTTPTSRLDAMWFQGKVIKRIHFLSRSLYFETLILEIQPPCCGKTPTVSKKRTHREVHSKKTKNWGLKLTTRFSCKICEGGVLRWLQFSVFQVFHVSPQTSWKRNKTCYTLCINSCKHSKLLLYSIKHWSSF